MGWKGKGQGNEQNIQRHKPGRQTQQAPWEETNLRGYTSWWATKKLQANPYLATDTDTNPEAPEYPRGWAVELCEGICRGRGSGKNKERRDRKGYKKGWSHVKRGRWAHLADWALRLVTEVCARFSLNPSLTISLCNLTLSPACCWGNWYNWGWSKGVGSPGHWSEWGSG